MVWAITQESIVPKTKMSLDLRKKITDVHKAGDVYDSISKGQELKPEALLRNSKRAT